MGVAVEGELHGGVAGEVLDVLRVHAAGEQDREASVPQIVPAYGGKPRALVQGFEVTIDYVLGVDRRKAHAGRCSIPSRP